MSLWFVAEVGRGTSLVAYVYGPYATKQAYLNANSNSYGSFQTVGNQNGYPSQAAAQSEANLLNTGSSSTQTQLQPSGPPANENYSPSQIGTRVQAAGGTTGELPKLPSWSLLFSGISGWFTRGLKVVFGGILLTAGILKLTNTDKTLNQVLPLVGGPVGKVLKV